MTNQTPKLDAHLSSGTIRLEEGGVLVGIASDGVAVHIGDNEHREQSK